MDSVVCGCHVYKSVWSPIIEQLILEKDPGNSHDELTVAVIGGSQMVGHILKNYSQIMCFLLHEGVCRLSYYWENEERKMLRSTM